MRVLIADDEQLARVNLRCILEDLAPHLEIVEARSGADLVAQAREKHFDAAFVDVRMPGMDGLEAMGLLAAEGRCPPWVVLSSYSDFSFARRALDLGASGYVLKPPSEDEIGAALLKLAGAAEAEATRKNEKFRREWTILVLGDKEGAPSLAPGSTVRVALICIDGLAPGRAGAGILEAARSLFEGRRCSYGEGIILTAAAIPRRDELREGQSIEAIVAAEPSLGDRGDPGILAAYLADAAAAIGALAADSAATGPLPRVLLAAAPPLVIDPSSGNQNARERISGLRELLSYRALLPEGDRDEEQLRRRIATASGPDLAAARAVVRLSEALAADARSDVQHRAPAAAESLGAATARAREECLRFLKRAAGDQAAQALASGEMSAFAVAETIRPRADPGGGPGAEDPRIVAVRRYVVRCIGSPEGASSISLASVAAALGYTPNYLSSLFRSLTGITFGEFLTALRLERSRELLAAGLSVKEAASAMGYVSERHYARIFRHRFGEAPGLLKARIARNGRAKEGKS